MKKRGIEITSVTDKAIGLKLPVVALEDLLNEKINLKDYGVGIKKIFFVFIVVPLTNTIHEEHIIYTETEQHLEIATRLNYEEVLIADSDKCMNITKLSFLEALEACQEYNISDFDWEGFLEKINGLLK